MPDQAKPGRVGLTFLSFGEDVASATAIGAFAGYRRNFGDDDMQLYGKVDTHLLQISQEREVFGIKIESDETKMKVMPGVGVQKGSLAVEVDYDLAGDWAGLNLYYLLGNVGQ